MELYVLKTCGWYRMCIFTRRVFDPGSVYTPRVYPKGFTVSISLWMFIVINKLHCSFFCLNTVRQGCFGIHRRAFLLNIFYRSVKKTVAHSKKTELVPILATRQIRLVALYCLCDTQFISLSKKLQKVPECLWLPKSLYWFLEMQFWKLSKSLYITFIILDIQINWYKGPTKCY